MPSKHPRQDLKRDIREALGPYFPDPDDIVGPGGSTAAVLRAVLPHLEAAYKRGETAAKLRQGSRLVVENERLRRVARQLKEERCP
ncbi:hypothetical protein ACFUJU_07720 [Streptomyces sp. NPDC057235]|uniref:hypothetical protein n=1 Tax=Streptomyces sp. NPDC057235 TaxID=3346058 RepID=UPI003643E0FB